MIRANIVYPDFGILYDLLGLNSNLAKYRVTISYFVDGQSFRNFTKRKDLTLQCSVQIFKTIGQLKWTLTTKEFSRFFCLR